MPRFKITSTSLAPLDQDWEEIALTDATEAAPCAITGRHALVLTNDMDVGDLPAAYLTAGAIVLSFPKFGDGRAYSQAQLLRQRRGYTGVLIAHGDVLADQVLFMRRCGFDAIDLSTLASGDTATTPDALTPFDHALTAFSHFYQPAADGSAPVWASRHRVNHKAA